MSQTFAPRNAVSIHTPTQGVTRLSDGVQTWYSVSIHTPTQGVTPSTFALSAVIPCFNPHTHAGCDLFLRIIVRVQAGFNPHTHAGCDGVFPATKRAIQCFNPHTHAGCDFFLLPCIFYLFCFNPHTHAGCDNFRAFGSFSANLFQSTHPRRV